MRTHTIVFTGLVGWFGGLATAMAITSCDPGPDECVGEHSPRPSVVVTFVTEGGTPVPADLVTFRLYQDAMSSGPQPPPSSAPELGTCLDDDCTRWALGSEQVGRFEIEAQACGEALSGTVEVGLDATGCQVQTERLEIQVDRMACLRDEQPPMTAPVACDKMARPSVYVSVVQRYDDYFAPVPVDEVWWSHDGVTDPARCVADAAGSCLAWVTGYELPGKFQVGTRWCEVDVSKTVEVGMTEDGCHVQTEFVLLEVETLGCLAADGAVPSEPKVPWQPVDPRYMADTRGDGDPLPERGH